MLAVPSARLEIFLLPASIPVELNLGPLLIVTLSKVTSFLVAKVKSFPDCVTSILFPLMNLTVSPPCTFSAVPLLATTFQAAVSLIFCTPAGSKLSSLLVAALFILSLVACAKSNVISVPVAVEVK